MAGNLKGRLCFSVGGRLDILCKELKEGEVLGRSGFPRRDITERKVPAGGGTKILSAFGSREEKGESEDEEEKGCGSLHMGKNRTKS